MSPTKEQIDKLKEAEQAAWGRENLEQEIRDRWLEQDFVDTFQTADTEAINEAEPIVAETWTIGEEITQQTTEWVEGFQEGQVVIPWVNTQEQLPEDIEIEPVEEIVPQVAEAPTPEPEAEEPVIDEPVVDEPTVDEPEIEQPVVEEIKSELQINAENKGYAFTKNEKWEVLLQPKDLDEAIDMYIDFGRNVRIDPTSKEAITWTKVFETYSKYNNAPTDVYSQGFKDNEIWVGWETWDRLVKMNGWEPTPEMLEAQRLYENDLKINNVNNTKNIVSGQTTETVDPTNDIQKLDVTYEKTIINLFWELSKSWWDFKKWNETLSDLNNSLASTTSQIDELNTEKRKILRNVKKRFPNMPLSQQLQIASEETQAVDDQLFVLQRQYNMDFSTYKFEQAKSQAEFEYQANIIDKKMAFAESIYWVKRWEAIRQEDIARQDKLLAEELERKEKDYLRAVAQWDKDAARDFAYDLFLTEAKVNLNKEFKFTTPEAWVVAIMNPTTWEVQFQRSDLDESFTWDIGWWNTFSWTVVDFIKESEWFRNLSYDDATWKNISAWTTAKWTPTIWYWFTTVAWQPVEAWMQITKDGKILSPEGQLLSTVDEELTNQINRHSNYLNKVSRPLNEAQKTALTSFEYNLWPNIWDWDGKWIIEKVNKWDFQWAAEEMKLFNKANWEFVQWLQNRRNKEASLLTSWELPSIDFTTDRLARNNAISLFLWETSFKDIEDLSWAAKNLINKMWVRIEDFRDNNLELVQTFERITWESAKTSDKEQVKNFNKAIAESALTDQSTSTIEWEIRNALLTDKAIWDEISAAVSVEEQLDVINELFQWTDTWLTVAWLNNAARKVWREIDQDITSIDQLTWAMLASYVKSISWVAVSEPEYQRLARQLPNLKDQPEVFQTMLDNFRNRNIQTWSVRARLRVNNDELFNKLFPELSTTPTTKTSVFRDTIKWTTTTDTSDVDEFIW